MPSKLLIAGFLCAESALVYGFFRDVVIAGFLALGVVWFLVDALIVWKNRSYSPAEMRLFMWAWNAVAIVGMLWNWTKGSLTHLSRIAGR